MFDPCELKEQVVGDLQYPDGNWRYQDEGHVDEDVAHEVSPKDENAESRCCPEGQR